MEQLTFPRFAALAVEGPDVPVHGVVRTVRFRPTGWTSSGHLPVPVGHGSGGRPLRVWLSGAAIRTQDSDGHVRVLGDGESVWTFDDGEEFPARSPRSALAFGGPFAWLLRRPELVDFVAGPFSRPFGRPTATPLLGRPAWRQEFEGDAELVVDAETGWVLRAVGQGHEGEWSEFSTAEQVVEFSWTGDARRDTIPPGPDLAAQQRQREAQEAAGMAWFTSTVGPAERHVTAEGRFPFVLEWLHEIDTETGAFHASLSRGEGGHDVSVQRWPSGATPAEEEEGAFVWSTERCTWSAQWTRDDLGDTALAGIAANLREGER